MLKSLKFDVTFPTGKSISREVDFPDGTLAINGSNGTGKSLILEMITYALFGIEAVRGAADDYKRCVVDLVLSVKGADYKIQRKNGSTATLFTGQGDEGAPFMPLVVGTRPVNAKVIELLGYGLPVFATGNNVGQGEIEALSKMKPAERKKMVDSTIGLDIIDALIEWVALQSSTFRKEAETVRGLAVEPAVVIQPDGYAPSAEVQPRVLDLTAKKAEKDQLVGWLSHTRQEPLVPACAVTETAEELRKVCDHHLARKATLEALRVRRDAIPEAKHTVGDVTHMAEELDRHEAWSVYDGAMAKLPARERATVHLTLETVAEHRARNRAYHNWATARQVWQDHTVDCPNCQHQFAVGFEDPGAEPPKPEFSDTQLNNAENALRAWSSAPTAPTCPRPEEPVGYTRQQLAAWRQAAEKAGERADLMIQITSFALPPDRSADYRTRLQYEANLVTYEREVASYAAWMAERAEKELRLQVFATVDTELQAAHAALAEATAYEKAVERYDVDKAGFDATVARADAAQSKAEAYKTAVAALRELKLTIKSYLVPSLNKVASLLVRQMTEGQVQELTDIQVDEEFNIAVDGQPIDTLNGSGKTVANLAIRIALGQILTNKVFSVLMCDEVDAACDDERAAAIATCLRALTKTIKQVFIVSHKNIEADHYLRLQG